MKPSLGRIVHVFADPAVNNGGDTAPAMITRVWSDQVVNVRVFRDGPPDPGEWMTSVTLHATREDAEAAHAETVKSFTSAGSVPPSVPYRAFWPPRIPGDTPPRY